MRRPLSSLALIAMLAAGITPTPAAATGASALRLPVVPAGVLTRNLYLGADLTPVIQAADFAQFLAATTEVWETVQGNDFHVRVRALADEIAWTRPALVGLQEAYTWRIQVPGDILVGGTTPAETVVYDYVPELLAELARRGIRYREAVSLPLFDFEAPIATGEDVRLTDHLVVLARADVEIRNPIQRPYRTLLPLTVFGQEAPVLVLRGWESVEARVHRGPWFTFVNTHLEAFHPEVRTAQAMELERALAGVAGPVVLVGDLNSLPGTEGEAVLAAAGFEDAWAERFRRRPGNTCCWPEDLSVVPSPPVLDQRIDYVLSRGPVRPLHLEVVGDRPWEREGGLWPSDHAGVAAWLLIGR